jgi:hypothetical protein
VGYPAEFDEGARPRTRVKVLIVIAAALLAVTAVAQLQHLAWSTARVENASPHHLRAVTILVDDARVRLEDVSPGESRFVLLPDRGDAGLSIEVSTLAASYRGCSEYVGGDMYHVRVRVSGSGEVSCSTELGIFNTRLMLLEMF